MELTEALAVLAAHRGGNVVITTMASVGAWPQFSDTPLDFAYMPSSMGQGPAIALGLALAQPQRGFIVISGDGSLLMNLGNLVTLGSYPARLYLLIMDNGLYEVTGGQPTVGAGRVDFAALARAAGIERVFSFDTVAGWQAGAAEALSGNGPVVVWLKITGRHGQKTPRPPRPCRSSCNGCGRRWASRRLDSLFITDHLMISLHLPRLLPVLFLLASLAAVQPALAEPAQETDLEALWRQVEKFTTKGKPPELYQVQGILTDLKPEAYTQPQGELLWKLARKLGVRENAYERKPNETMPRQRWQDADCIRLEELYPHLRPNFQPTPELTKAFQEFLAKKVARPGEVGINAWDDAKLVLQDKSSLLYYHTHLFLTEHALSKPLDLRGPLSPDPDYWPKEATWVRPYRRKALSEPWSKEISYLVPEVSPQSSGYLLAALRCGAKERNLPITWNLSCDTPGTTPENLRRAYYTAIAYGAKRINFRGAVPEKFAQGKHSIGGQDAVKMWQTLHDLIHETGQFEKVIHAAMPRRADVALLISFAQDLWDPDPDRNHERKCIYLACRHGGYSVEFITEEDIQAGNYKHLKAIITTGNHLERATARELLRFVRDGGTLSCFGYSGFRDEHNRPMDILGPALGVTAVKEKRQGTLGLSKKDLPALVPVDTVQWGTDNVEHQMPALVLRNSFEVRRGATVFGKYADGSPMAVRFDHGSGGTWVFGTFLASSYVRDGLLPARPWQPGPGADDINNTLPTTFRSDIGDIITAVCADARYEVYFDKKLIEPVLLDGPNGVALILINWNPTPQNVLVTIETLPAGVTKATSITQGELLSQRAGRSMRLRVRVNVTEVILFSK